MSFSVTLKVADKDLGPLLAKLGAKTRYDLKHHTHDDEESPLTLGKTNGRRVSPTTYIMMLDIASGEHRPDKSTQPGFALNELEKLEKKHGVGEVTRSQLTARLKGSVSSPGSVITAMLTDGWITGVWDE